MPYCAMSSRIVASRLLTCHKRCRRRRPDAHLVFRIGVRSTLLRHSHASNQNLTQNVAKMGPVRKSFITLWWCLSAFNVLVASRHVKGGSATPEPETSSQEPRMGTVENPGGASRGTRRRVENPTDTKTTDTTVSKRPLTPAVLGSPNFRFLATH